MAMLHRNNRYIKQKKEMNRQLEHMFALLDQMLEDLSAFINESAEATAKELEKSEAEINSIEKSLEATVIDLLSVQQATAKDMRDFLSKMKMNRDLERIGDHIISILHMYQRSDGYPQWMVTELNAIISIERKMLERIKQGILAEDEQAIQQAIAMDDHVDQAHIKLFENLVTEMKHSDIDADTGSKLIMMLRFLERLGDHIVNIGEAFLDFKR